MAGRRTAVGFLRGAGAGAASLSQGRRDDTNLPRAAPRRRSLLPGPWLCFAAAAVPRLYQGKEKLSLFASPPSPGENNPGEPPRFTALLSQGSRAQRGGSFHPVALPFPGADERWGGLAGCPGGCAAASSLSPAWGDSGKPDRCVWVCSSPGGTKGRSESDTRLRARSRRNPAPSLHNPEGSRIHHALSPHTPCRWLRSAGRLRSGVRVGTAREGGSATSPTSLWLVRLPPLPPLRATLAVTSETTSARETCPVQTD